MIGAQLNLFEVDGAKSKVEEAKLVYLRQEKCELQYEHCWNVLRYELKWINLGSQGLVKKKVFSSSTINLDDEENATSDFVDLVRPPGVKMTKDDGSDEQEKGKGKRKRKARDTSQFDVTFNKFIEGKRKDDEGKMEMAKQQLEMDKKKLDIELLRVQADKDRQDAKQEKENQALMMMDVNKFETEMQRVYFAKLQADAFARRMSK